MCVLEFGELMDFFALASKIIQTNDQGLKPRYKNSVDLKYPFNNLEKTDVSNDKLLVFTTIFSLAGVLGVLPLPIREELLKRHREKDDSLRDFIDIFNSRAIDFLVAIQGKRTFRINSSIHSKLGSLGSVLQSIVGFYNYGEEQNSHVGTSFYVYFGGYFSARVRNQENLQQMLSFYLGVTVEVEMFCQGWENIDQKFQGKLSFDKNFSSSLGVDMILGKRVRMFQRQCRISIGPLDKSRFQEFLPGGDWLNKIKEIVKVYWNNSVSVELKLIRKADSIGPTSLGKKNYFTRLGRDSWLFSCKLVINRDDCHFKLMEIGSFR